MPIVVYWRHRHHPHRRNQATDLCAWGSCEDQVGGFKSARQAVTLRFSARRRLSTSTVDMLCLAASFHCYDGAHRCQVIADSSVWLPVAPTNYFAETVNPKFHSLKNLRTPAFCPCLAAARCHSGEANPISTSPPANWAYSRCPGPGTNLHDQHHALLCRALAKRPMLAKAARSSGLALRDLRCTGRITALPSRSLPISAWEAPDGGRHVTASAGMARYAAGLAARDAILRGQDPRIRPDGEDDRAATRDKRSMRPQVDAALQPFGVAVLVRLKKKKTFTLDAISLWT